MSKINRMQAEALAAPVEKTVTPKKPLPVKTAAKPVTTKTTASKPTAASKTATAKPAAAKPAASKPAASKPVASKTTTKPLAAKKAEKVKAEKPSKEKTPKLKMERDSFTMPKTEYAQFHVLKERLNKLGQPAKKSELLRAGIMQLSAMTDAALKAAMNKVPAIKTGRPKK